MRKKANIGQQLERLAKERAPRDRAALLAEIMGFAETDLLYYRASEPKLAARQQALFDPILAGLTKAYSIRFTVTQGVMPVTQPEASLLRLRMEFEGANERELAALFVMVPLLGSALLALGVWKGLLPLEEAIAAATLDEAFQAEQWAEDAQEKVRRDATCADIRQCALFLKN